MYTLKPQVVVLLSTLAASEAVTITAAYAIDGDGDGIAALVYSVASNHMILFFNI